MKHASDAHIWNLFTYSLPIPVAYFLFKFIFVTGGGLDLLALLAFFSSVFFSFFTQNKGGGGLCPSPRSATDFV